MKNYSAMSTKKLNALMETANDAEAIEIQSVIDSRTQTIENEAVVSEDTQSDDSQSVEMSPEDLEALEAIKNGSIKSEEKSEKANKVNKMTYDECVDLAKSLEIHVGHICKVVPFNTIEWADGIIRGVIADKRSNKVLYAIRVSDGRNIVKAHDSKMLQISEETAEIVTKRRKSNTTAEKLNDEELMIVASELSVNVGKHVSYKPTKELYSIIDDKVTLLEKMDGTIMAIVPDKRSGRILYRIQTVFSSYDELTDTSKDETIIVHKVSSAQDVIISDTYDEEVRNKFLARQESVEMRKNMTPADMLEICKKAVEKAKADFEKATTALENRNNDLLKAEEEYAKWLENQSVETAENADETNMNESTEVESDMN